MPLNSKYSVFYQHRLITIGDEWYADVQVMSIDPSFDRTTLLHVLSVKHGWPIDNIVVSDIHEAPLPGVPFVDYRVIVCASFTWKAALTQVNGAKTSRCSFAGPPEDCVPMTQYNLISNNETC